MCIVFTVYYICTQFIYGYISHFIFKMGLIIVLNTKLIMMKKWVNICEKTQNSIAHESIYIGIIL